MYAMGRLISQGVYTVSAPFHPFGGAVDIIVVEQPDGSFKSSPWYVKFGKFQGVLKTKEKIVSINVNGVDADFHMYLDHKGEAYFLREVDEEEIDSTIFSPPSSGDEVDDPSRNGKIESSKTYDFSESLDGPNDFNNGKVMVRTSSRRSRIFGLVFGRKSMKETNKQEGGGDISMERIGSLDQAEIAAELLEVKWSTNLSTDIARVNNKSRVSVNSMPAKETDEVCQLNDDQGLARLLVPDSVEPGFDQCVGQALDPYNEEMGNNFALGIECSNGASSPARSPRSEKQDKDTSIPETSVLEEKSELISETSIRIRKFDLGNATLDDRESKMQYMVDGAADEKARFLDSGPPTEESENLFVGEGHEISNLSQAECKGAQIDAGDSCETANLVPEVKSQPECSTLMNYDNSNDIKLHSDEDSAEFQNTNATFRCEGSSIRDDTGKGMMEFHSSFGMVTSESGEAEALALIQGETITERLSEVDSLGVCISSSRNNSISLDQEEEYSGEGEMNNLHNRHGSDTKYLSSKTSHLSHPSVDISSEVHFLFDEIDGFITNADRCRDSSIPDCLEIENDSLVTMNDIEDYNRSSAVDRGSHLASVKLMQEGSPKAFDPLLNDPTTKSSPISIPGSRKCAEEGVEWTIGSLPNFRSHIDKLEVSDVLHPLSHSLDSPSERLRQELRRKDVSISSDLDTKHQLAVDDPTIKETRIWEEFKTMSTNSTVELSLCKHLLYEGMGADAASQAFDAEKVDLEKCASLGPQLVKNDNLILRIGGRYFPWDAAASYILEMLTLGHDQIFEPEGMIAVDRVEKTIEGELSRANVPSGGSWTLWPFRRSRTINAVQPAQNCTNDSVVVNDASEIFNDASEDKSSPVVKVAKTKVKSIVPTSEQLETLNLKQGRNVITFTFSTAMLGKQQLDARIYLWKWNTRIVVSDVDGTITRSDVLGQFMPLVGRDWSHIGVAHLFSAIKENGYQLLFLSARAISQAHLTRQFLFNLKQDGKALPDGPVVISPDGLFPSLFREVIRRAPHEFKIACLQDIRALFPADSSPFYAGFGNRITDEISYLKLGIPKGKIFIINAKGEVAVSRRFDNKSYTSLHALVDGMFPAKTSAEQEDFNSWNYWKMPLPDIRT